MERGYITPNPPAPYDSLCIKVYVPNHVFYLGAFWQAYQFFTTWIAWARDPLHRGKIAAALWRTAYDRARAEFEIRKGNCEMAVTDIRLNPNNKCDLQVRYDGGDWTSVADLSDCNGCGGGSGGALQFDGLNITQYNSCDNTFEPVGEPYNPLTSSIYDSLYSEDGDGACNGAANIAAWLNHLSNVGLQAETNTSNLGAVASEILGIIVGITGIGLVFNTVLTALVGLFSLEGSEWGDAIDIDIQSDMRDALFPYMSEDGTIREPNWSAALDAMQEIHDGFDLFSPERTRWGFELMILRTLGPSIVSRQNKYAGITDADCTGSGWTKVFDFTTSKQGWVLSTTEVGVYASGQGWKDGLHNDESDTKTRGLAIKIGMPLRTITSVKVYYDATLGTNTAGDAGEYRNVQWFKNFQTVGDLVDDELTEDGVNVYQWSGSESLVSTLIVAATVGHDSVDPRTDPGGEITVSKIILSGEGINPFT